MDPVDPARHDAAGRAPSPMHPQLAALEKITRARLGPPSKGSTESQGPLDNGQLMPTGKKKTIATRLVDLACLNAEFFHSPDQEPFAKIKCDDHDEIWRVRSKTFKLWLTGVFFRKTAGAVGGQSMEDALTQLSAMGLFQGPERPVALRIAEHAGDIFLDLGRPEWQAVRISKLGWEVVNVSPVAFRRSKGLQPLPIPTSGGSLEPLRELLNFAADSPSWTLIVAFLLAALRPRGPYPLLAVDGEQGAGESFLVRTLKGVIDPGKAGNRSAPRDERDLMVAATNSHLLSFDNLSFISSELSDALCRLSTGGGFATRELYSDADEMIFSAIRPSMVNGIAEVVQLADLADRTLLLSLPAISGEQRMPESVLARRLDEIRPGVLGCLLNAVSHGLRNIETVTLPSLPRMSDFALWVVACCPAFGWPPERFLDAYATNRSDAIELGMSSSPLAMPLRLLAAGGMWEGSASDLLERLSDIVTDSVRRSKSWPVQANGLSNQLKRMAPALREAGLILTWHKRSPHGRFIRLEQCDISPSPPSLRAAGDHTVTIRDDQ